MAVNTLEAKVSQGGSRGDVLIESDLESFPAQIEELMSAGARDHVLSSAVKEGIKGQPGISRMSEPPHPLNYLGESIENLKDEDGVALPPRHPRMQPSKYQARYEVTARQ